MTFTGSRRRFAALFPLKSAWLLLVLLAPALAHGAPVRFNIPAQAASLALSDFIDQAKTPVMFNRDELKAIQANAVVGDFEIEAALRQLLQKTGYSAQRNPDGNFAVSKAAGSERPGSIVGSIRDQAGRPIMNARIQTAGSGAPVLTERSGAFVIDAVAPGTHWLLVSAEGMQNIRVTDIVVRSGSTIELAPITIPARVPGIVQLDDVVVSAKKNDGLIELDPYEVSAQRTKPFTTANMDIPRTIDDVQAYYIFDSKAIARSGASDPEDFLRKNLTMEASAWSGQQAFGNSGQSSSISLRGLGDNQTVILINGRRSSGPRTSYSGANQTDLNGIPLAAIDRIEVLPTSASAIYGSNAIGGVVNVVLKRNYAGGEVRASYQNTFDTDAPIRKVDLTYGFALNGGRTQVMLTGSWSDMSPLLYQDRPFLRDYDLRFMANNGGESGGVSYVGATPNIRGTNLTLKPAFGGGVLGKNVTYIPPGTSPTTPPATLGAGLLANAGRQNLNAPDSRQLRGGLRAYMGTPFDTQSFFGSIRHELTPWLELNGEFAYTGTRNERNMTITTSQSIASTVPTNPFNQTLTVNMDIAGEYPVRSNNLSRRSTLGFIMKLPREWALQGDYTWSTGTNSYYATSPLATVDVTAALNAGTLNPFVDTTLYPFDLSRYVGTQTFNGAGTLNDVTVRLAGPVWRWRAGAIVAAAGLERRQEGYGNAPTDTIFPNFPARNTASLSLGKKQVTNSAYLEFLVPLVAEANRLPFVRQFDLQLAARAEDFDVNTGTSSLTLLPAPATAPVIASNRAQYKSTQPTAGFRLVALEGVTLRASYSGGFLSPSYGQLLLNPLPSTALTNNLFDLRRGSQPVNVQTLSGGNPDLVPETSKSWNAGVIFQPQRVKGLRLSVDWYKIEKTNNIGTLTGQALLDQESSFPDRVIRGPVPAGDPYGVGPITMLNYRNLNLLKSLNEGIDINVRYRRDTHQFGLWEISLLASYAEHAKTQSAITVPVLDRVNYSMYGPLKLRHTSNLVWEQGHTTIGWTTYYFNRFNVYGPPVSTSNLSVISQGGPTVPHQIYHDLFAAYRFGPRQRSETRSRLSAGLNQMLSGFEVQLNIRNVFDKIPPFDVVSNGSYYYSTWGDLRLREYRITLRKPF